MKPSQPLPFRVLLFLIISVGCVFSMNGGSAARAQGSGWETIRLPTNRNSVDGFTCDIELMSPGNEGYVPLKFTARAAGGQFPGDRFLMLRVSTVGKVSFPRGNYSYELPITLKANTPSADATFYLPKYFQGRTLAIGVYDQNGLLPDYSYETSGGLQAASQAGVSPQDLASRIAIILPDTLAQLGTQPQPWQRVPDLRSIDSGIYPDGDFLLGPGFQRADDAMAMNYLQVQSPHASQILRLSESYDNWLGYESIDIVLIAFPLLDEMKQQHPRKYEALRQWVSSGGALWTFAAPSQSELATFFETSLPAPLSANTPDPLEIANAKSARNLGMSDPSEVWTVQRLIAPGRPSTYSQAILNMSPQQIAAAHGGGHPFTQTVSYQELRQQLTSLPLEAGVVVGIAAQDPFPGSSQLWHAARHLTGANQSWRFRRATSLTRGTSNYWDWLLNNVARPPVYAFLTLFTVFVILVGPVSFYFTRRYSRMHLMFIIAPVLATLATLAMFGYGFIADGLGTQARVRQITWINGTSGRAVQYSRATYFSTFREIDGLAFPTHLAVYPVRDRHEMFVSQRRATAEEFSITLGQQQQFQKDFFPARSQRQFVSFNPTIKTDGLSLTVDASGNATLRNSLSTTLLNLLVRDQTGRVFQLARGKTCPPGETVALTPLADKELGAIIRRLYLNHRPEPPYGYTPNSANRSDRYEMDVIEELTTANRTWAASTDSLGVFEARLQTTTMDKADLPNGWFLGIAEVNEEDLGREGAKVVESVHYVLGSLP